jgi:hypothetical protein
MLTLSAKASCSGKIITIFEQLVTLACSWLSPSCRSTRRTTNQWLVGEMESRRSAAALDRLISHNVGLDEGENLVIDGGEGRDWYRCR